MIGGPRMLLQRVDKNTTTQGGWMRAAAANILSARVRGAHAVD
jgi:hypothetical protein